MTTRWNETRLNVRTRHDGHGPSETFQNATTRVKVGVVKTNFQIMNNTDWGSMKRRQKDLRTNYYKPFILLQPCLCDEKTKYTPSPYRCQKKLRREWFSTGAMGTTEASIRLEWPRRPLPDTQGPGLPNDENVFSSGAQENLDGRVGEDWNWND